MYTNTTRGPMTLLFLTLFSCVNPNAPIEPGEDTPFVFEVPQGATASGLGPRLEEARLLPDGLLPGPLQWKLFLRSEDAGCLKAGRFEVHRSMSLNELLETLCGVPLAEDVPFTVLEGWRIQDIDAALTEKGWIERSSSMTLSSPSNQISGPASKLAGVGQSVEPPLVLKPLEIVSK